MKKVIITCQDGVELAGILITVEKPRAMVQINSATATPKEYYLAFAKFLVEHNYSVLMFDYRGVCESQPKGGLRNCQYEYLDWPLKDIPAAIDFSKSLYPNLPLYFVGHSVGGQTIGLLHNKDKIVAMYAFGTSSGYWGHMNLSYRLLTHFFFEIVRPITKYVFGYSKLKFLNIMEDIPYKMTDKWREWCSVPDYFFNEKYYHEIAEYDGFKSLEMPIKMTYADDDLISNQKNVESLWRNFESCKGIEIECYTSEKGKPIGHFGYFRKKHKETIWPKVIAFFDSIQIEMNSENKNIVSRK